MSTEPRPWVDGLTFAKVLSATAGFAAVVGPGAGTATAMGEGVAEGDGAGAGARSTAGATVGPVAGPEAGRAAIPPRRRSPGRAGHRPGPPCHPHGAPGGMLGSR